MSEIAVPIAQSIAEQSAQHLYDDRSVISLRGLLQFTRNSNYDNFVPAHAAQLFNGFRIVRIERSKSWGEWKDCFLRIGEMNPYTSRELGACSIDLPHIRDLLDLPTAPIPAVVFPNTPTRLLLDAVITSRLVHDEAQQLDR